MWFREKREIRWMKWDGRIEKCKSCSKSAAGLLPCSHQADIRMRSHCLLQLDDNKSAASCQKAWCKLIFKTFYPQAWCKLIVRIFYPQAWCKLFQQLAANLSRTRNNYVKRINAQDCKSRGSLFRYSVNIPTESVNRVRLAWDERNFTRLLQ